MVKIRKRLGKIEKRFYLTFRQQLVWMVSTAFAIAAALTWKDTITLILKTYLHTGTEVQFALYSALIFTIVGVIVIWLINELFKTK